MPSYLLRSPSPPDPSRYLSTDSGQDQLSRLPGMYDDWLACMISTQVSQAIAGFDEVIQDSDPDFSASGLNMTSVIRSGRLAVVDGAILLGAIGEIGPARMKRIMTNLREWLS